ncbi:30S ribosomal protein S17e [Nanoarchaeota archaeon]
MGRIKTQLIKSTTTEILKKHRDKFTTDFQKNKEIVGGVANLPSKKIRNIIAGYITRLLKSE